MPVEARGATYLSFKILYDLFTPQIYLIVFWYIPKSLFVSDVLRKQTIMEIVDEPDSTGVSAGTVLLEDSERQPDDFGVNTSL